MACLFTLGCITAPRGKGLTDVGYETPASLRELRAGKGGGCVTRNDPLLLCILIIFFVKIQWIFGSSQVKRGKRGWKGVKYTVLDFTGFLKK